MQLAPPQFVPPLLITFATYVPTAEQLAVALRSWNGLKRLNQVPELHTPDEDAPVVMIPWPLLFCQKPIVRPPLTGPQTRAGGEPLPKGIVPPTATKPPVLSFSPHVLTPATGPV